MATADKIQAMRQAIALSAHGLGTTSSNPHLADPTASLSQLCEGDARTARVVGDTPLSELPIKWTALYSVTRIFVLLILRLIRTP